MTMREEPEPYYIPAQTHAQQRTSRCASTHHSVVRIVDCGFLERLFGVEKCSRVHYGSRLLVGASGNTDLNGSQFRCIHLSKL
jgi:hypothetical protein